MIGIHLSLPISLNVISCQFAKERNLARPFITDVFYVYRCHYLVFSFSLISQQIGDVRCVGPSCFSVQRLTSFTRPNKHVTNTLDSCCTAHCEGQYTTEYKPKPHNVGLIRKVTAPFTKTTYKAKAQKKKTTRAPLKHSNLASN